MRPAFCLIYWTNKPFTGEMLHLDSTEKAITYRYRSVSYEAENERAIADRKLEVCVVLDGE